MPHVRYGNTFKIMSSLFIVFLFFVVPWVTRAADPGECIFGCKDGITFGTGKDACVDDAACQIICDQACKAAKSTCDFNICGVPVKVGDGCAAQADLGQVALVELQTGDAKTWSCQDVADKASQSKCVTSPACAQGKFCCAPGIGSVGPSSTPVAPTPPPSVTPRQASIWIPQYLLECMDIGSCTLDQIVATAAAFANFLFGISGAVALAILVYGGFRYLMSAGRTEEVTAAKKMITGAAIGLVIIFGANALIRFVLISFTRQTAQPTACESRPGYSCQVMQGGSKKDIAKRAKSLGCEDASQNLCAAPDQGQNVFCCPLEPPK
ncbi:MAG: pilin [Candidatus Uhrbacteria bacterium]|nr:pilin [Candidatus Uhrbacteria bacterium]